MFNDIQYIFEDILSDDEEDIINIIEGPRRDRVFRERPDHINLWSDEEYVNRFRISKASTRFLLNYIENDIARISEQNHALSSLTQLLVTLRFYATGSFLIVAGDFGGIHKSTASRVIRDVSQAIALQAPIFNKMPTTEQELISAKSEMYGFARFPNCIGAIDCTHVKIQSPGGHNAEQFRNRKGYFSINVQTVSDANLKINNIVARWPGASVDRTIFDNSRLKADFEQERFGDSYLVGDSGYTLSRYLMIPLDNPQTQAEMLYNESQIRTRNVVERQYGVWKRRFPILKLTLRLKLPTTLTVIMATAVLHNIAINMGDRVPDDEIHIEVGDAHFNHVHENNINGLFVRRALIQVYFQDLLQEG